MKRLSAILLMALAATYLSPRARADGKTEGKDGQAAESVEKANRSLTEAILKGDAKAFDRLTSDDYVLTSATGRLLEKKKTLEALETGVLTFDKFDDSDVKVRLYADTAVVTGRAEIKGKSKTRAFDDEFRWTRVFVRRDGAWKCVTEQLSRVWAPEEPAKDKETTKEKGK